MAIENAKRDENHIPTLLAVSSTDGTTPIRVYANATTHRLLVDTNGASGTFTSQDGKTVTVANGIITSIV